jgi:hypothetical protein
MRLFAVGGKHTRILMRRKTSMPAWSQNRLLQRSIVGKILGVKINFNRVKTPGKLTFGLDQQQCPVEQQSSQDQDVVVTRCDRIFLSSAVYFS